MRLFILLCLFTSSFCASSSSHYVCSEIRNLIHQILRLTGDNLSKWEEALPNILSCKNLALKQFVEESLRQLNPEGPRTCEEYFNTELFKLKIVNGAVKDVDSVLFKVDALMDKLCQERRRTREFQRVISAAINDFEDQHFAGISSYKMLKVDRAHDKGIKANFPFGRLVEVKVSAEYGAMGIRIGNQPIQEIQRHRFVYGGIHLKKNDYYKLTLEFLDVEGGVYYAQVAPIDPRGHFLWPQPYQLKIDTLNHEKENDEIDDPSQFIVHVLEYNEPLHEKILHDLGLTHDLPIGA